MKKKIKNQKPKVEDFSWIFKQQEDVNKVFAPIIDYDDEYDMLYIRWLPQFKTEYSLESKDGFVFDIAKINKNEEVVGIEIFDFKEKIKNEN